MSWQLFTAIGVLLYSVNGLLHRVLMKDQHSDPYAQTIMFAGLVGIFGWFILCFRDISLPPLTPNNIILLTTISILSAIGGVFAFKGFKYIEASEHTILLTSSKLWSLLGAVLILGETLTFKKLLGGLIIISGVLIAEWRKHKFVFNTGALYVLIAAASYALGEILSFFVLRDFDSTSFLVLNCLIMVVLMLIAKPKIIPKFAFYSKPKNLINILIVSFNDTFATLAVFFAYQLGRNALQIGPLMATQTIVTVILAHIFLRERDNLLQKFIGASLAVIGAIIVL
ncbi:MAG: DMT family transporter [bacterium]